MLSYAYRRRNMPGYRSDEENLIPGGMEESFSTVINKHIIHVHIITQKDKPYIVHVVCITKWDAHMDRRECQTLKEVRVYVEETAKRMVKSTMSK